MRKRLIPIAGFAVLCFLGLSGAAVKYTPEGLIGDLPMRLAYLRSRAPEVGFYIRAVKSRENLWGIALKKHYSVHTLIGCNPQMETYQVANGQKILVPSRAGILHIVQPGDTWQKIADRYKTTVFEIKRFNADTGLSKGDMVFVADRRPDMSLMNEKMREKI